MLNHFRARVIAAAAMLCTGAAVAQTFPSKPITLVVPFAAGASADGIARIVGRELSQALGQPVVVDNKPGAGGALGLMQVAKAAPDGHTLGLGATGAIAINPHLPDAAPLKPQQDLQPLAKLADIPLVFATSPSSGYGNLQAFLKASRSKQGGLSFGTAGQYTAQHLSGELLASMAGVPITAVAYRGSGPAVTDLLGGMLPAAMVDLTAAYPHIKAGKLTALGVTSATRSKVAPEIPTLAEEGVKGYSAPAWMGLFLPAKTPAAVSAKYSEALKKIMAEPSVRTQIEGLAAEPAYMDGQGFNQFIGVESRKWAGVIKALPAPAK